MLPELLKFGASGNVIVVKQSYSVLQDITRMMLNIDLLQVMGLRVVVLNSEDCYRSDAVTQVCYFLIDARIIMYTRTFHVNSIVLVHRTLSHSTRSVFFASKWCLDMGSGISLNCKDSNCKICLFRTDYSYLMNKEYIVIRVF